MGYFYLYKSMEIAILKIKKYIDDMRSELSEFRIEAYVIIDNFE